jgi:prepilin-type N-terminal cleavage/methylation domain-containing protein/prepilin-type processing-associated H-X9-DG protein
MLSSSYSRNAFSLVELLVVIAIIAVLAAMLMPAIKMVKASAMLTNCGNNQGQIVKAMMAYRGDNNQRFPVSPSDNSANSTWTIGSTNMNYTAYASQEMLCDWADLPLASFNCPANTFNKVTLDPAQNLNTVVGTASKWGPWTDYSNPPPSRPSYRYDWSTPSKAYATRVVLTDMPGDYPVQAKPTQNWFTWHGSRAVVAFADGHVATLVKTMATTSTANHRTWSFWGDVVDLSPVNPDASDDLVWDDTGDATASTINMSMWDAGSVTRCWVR